MPAQHIVMVALLQPDFQINPMGLSVRLACQIWTDAIMDDRKEYWWVFHEAAIQPAEVGFRGGIPVSFRFIGMAGSIPAASAELIERLPSPPAPVLNTYTKPSSQPQAQPQRRGSWLWFIGVLLLILVAQCSGQLFDMLK